MQDAAQNYVLTNKYIYNIGIADNIKPFFKIVVKVVLFVKWLTTNDNVYLKDLYEVKPNYHRIAMVPDEMSLFPLEVDISIMISSTK